MRKVVLLGLCACAIAAAAEPPYAGKWKMNLAKSNFGESTITYEQQPGGGYKATMDGQSYTFKTDGSETPTPWGSTMAAKAVDAKTMQVTEKTNGKVSMTGTMKVSDDGKTLTMNGKRMKADGSSSDESMTLQRASGGPGFAGKWKMGKMNSSSPETMTLTPTANGVKIEIGGVGGVCDAKFDGKDHPASGAMWPSGWSCNVAKSGANALAVVWRKDGKDMYKITWTPSGDGKTLTEKGSAATVNEPFTVVYDRQ